MSLPGNACINGRFVSSASDKPFVATNPATGDELGHVPSCRKNKGREPHDQYVEMKTILF